MTQLLNKPRSISRRIEGIIIEGIIPAGREVSPPVAGPGRIEVPTHPAVPRLRTGRLHFAPAPAEDADRPAPTPRTDAPRMDWTERAFEAGWVGLLMACAAECASRLL